MPAFEMLAKKRGLEEQIAALEVVKAGHVKEAKYEKACEVRGQVEAIQAQLDQCNKEVATWEELEQVFELLKAVATKVPFGELVNVLMEDRFKNLRPLLEHILGPHLKLS